MLMLRKSLALALALVIIVVGHAPLFAQAINVGSVPPGASNCRLTAGSASPEAAVVGKPCDLYLRTDGTLWQKANGTGNDNSGWVQGINGQTLTSAASLTGTLVVAGTGTIGGQTISSAANFTGTVTTASAVTTDAATAANSRHTFKVSGTQKGLVGLSGAVLGDSSTHMAIFAETGAGVKVYTNGSATSPFDIDTAGSVGSPAYASQTTDWRISKAGAADFRYLFTDELRAKVFSADLEQVLRGSAIVAKSFGIISQTFNCPSAGGTRTLWIQDAPEVTNTRLFAVNDWIVMHTFSRTDGDSDGNLDLTIADCIGQVSSYADGSGANEGQQSWTFTRGTGGSAGALTGGTDIAVDQVAIDYGVSGNGVTEQSAIDGAEAVNAPYFQTKTFTTSPVAGNFSVTTRMGNLGGICGYSGGTFGFVAGDCAATNITIDTTNGIRIRSGTTNKLVADTSGNLSIVGDLSIGTAGVARSGATDFTTGTGWVLDYNAGTPRARFGTTAGNRLSWDGTNLTLVSATVNIGSTGIAIPIVATSAAGPNAYKFSPVSVDGAFAGMFGFELAGQRFIGILNDTDGNGNAVRTYLSANNGSSANKEASILLNVTAQSGTNASSITYTAELHSFAGGAVVLGSTVYLGGDVWHLSLTDGANRLHFENAGATHFGSPDGYTWRNTGNSTIMSLTNAGVPTFTALDPGGTAVYACIGPGGELYANAGGCP